MQVDLALNDQRLINQQPLAEIVTINSPFFVLTADGTYQTTGFLSDSLKPEFLVKITQNPTLRMIKMSMTLKNNTGNKMQLDSVQLTETTTTTTSPVVNTVNLDGFLAAHASKVFALPFMSFGSIMNSYSIIATVKLKSNATFSSTKFIINSMPTTTAENWALSTTATVNSNIPLISHIDGVDEIILTPNSEPINSKITTHTILCNATTPLLVDTIVQVKIRTRLVGSICYTNLISQNFSLKIQHLTVVVQVGCEYPTISEWQICSNIKQLINGDNSLKWTTTLHNKNPSATNDKLTSTPPIKISVAIPIESLTTRSVLIELLEIDTQRTIPLSTIIQQTLSVIPHIPTEFDILGVYDSKKVYTVRSTYYPVTWYTTTTKPTLSVDNSSHDCNQSVVNVVPCDVVSSWTSRYTQKTNGLTSPLTKNQINITVYTPTGIIESLDDRITSLYDSIVSGQESLLNISEWSVIIIKVTIPNNQHSNLTTLTSLIVNELPSGNVIYRSKFVIPSV